MNIDSSFQEQGPRVNQPAQRGELGQIHRDQRIASDLGRIAELRVRNADRRSHDDNEYKPELKNTVERIGQQYHSRWGKYLSPRGREVLETVGDRFIVADPVKFLADEGQARRSRPDVLGTADPAFFVVRDPEFTRIGPELQAFPGMESFLLFTQQFPLASAHELGHTLSAEWSIPAVTMEERAFFELGARWYAEQVLAGLLNENGQGQPLQQILVGQEDIEQKRVVFYNELLNKYKGSVHRLFFADKLSPLDKVARWLILKKIGKNLPALFPDRATLGYS